MSSGGNHPGTLVCFEGGDGAGKTTLAQAVVEALRLRGMSPVLLDKKDCEGYPDPQLRERMRDLRRVLWDYPRDAALWEWGDEHWFHLIVSWFSVLDRCLVRPLLRDGAFVIIDNWYFKFAARFRLKPEFSPGVVAASFAHLSEPDLVVFVDVDPAVAVTRRLEFSATESGRMDGRAKGDSADFVDYQGRVLGELRALQAENWTRFEATNTPFETLVVAASARAAAAWRQSNP